MAGISSREDLEKWLSDQPAELAQILAARSCLRSICYAFGSDPDYRLPDNFWLYLFRAAVIASSFPNFSFQDRSQSGSIAAAEMRDSIGLSKAYRSQADVDDNEVIYSLRAADAAGYAAARALDCISSYDIDQSFCFPDLVARASYVLHAENFAARRYAVSKGLLPRFGEVAEFDQEYWASISTECDDVGGNLEHDVLSERLWTDSVPDVWRHAYQAMQTRLSTDVAFDVWMSWYDRRVTGKRPAFDIERDNNRRENKKILRRLVEAQDIDFWSKGALYVNATLQVWIDEARARVAPGLEPDADGGAALPAQAPHAVRFQAAADGRIAIDAGALVDTLRTDAEARDRHAEALALARAMLAGCQGSNAGARMIAMLEAYLEAAGDGIETMRPSLFVQRGERLRQELAGYARPDTMLAPLADAVLLDGQSWRSAHNMAVGLDPVLMALDTAQRGPDVQPALLEPDAIRTLARAADAAGALVEGVAAVVIEAADLAPAVPDPADRRTRWSSDTAQNLVIEAFAVALNYPLTTITGIATFGALGWAGAAVFGGALGAAKFLISHRLWIETRLGDSPTWQSLFVQLCERLEAHTPFRPNDRDDGA